MERHPGSRAGSEPKTERESWFVRDSASGGMDPAVRDEAAATRANAAGDGAADAKGASAAESVDRVDLPKPVAGDAGGIKRATNSGGAIGEDTASAEQSAPAEPGKSASGIDAPLAALPPALPRRYATPPRVGRAAASTEGGADRLSPPISGMPEAGSARAPAEQDESVGEPQGSRESAAYSPRPSAGELVAIERDSQDPRSSEVMSAGDRGERRADPFNALDIREWF